MQNSSLVKSSECEDLPTGEFIRPLDGETVEMVLRDDDYVVIAAETMIYMLEPGGPGYLIAVTDNTSKERGQILMKGQRPGPQPAMRGYNITAKGLEVLDKFPGGVQPEGEGPNDPVTSPEEPAQKVDAAKPDSTEGSERRSVNGPEPEAWKRLKIESGAGDNVAKLDGQTYRIKGAGCTELLRALQKKEGGTITANALEAMGFKPCRAYDRLPEPLQRIIDKPGRGQIGYRMI